MKDTLSSLPEGQNSRGTSVQDQSFLTSFTSGRPRQTFSGSVEPQHIYRAFLIASDGHIAFRVGDYDETQRRGGQKRSLTATT